MHLHHGSAAKDLACQLLHNVDSRCKTKTERDIWKQQFHQHSATFSTNEISPANQCFTSAGSNNLGVTVRVCGYQPQGVPSPQGTPLPQKN